VGFFIIILVCLLHDVLFCFYFDCLIESLRSILYRSSSSVNTYLLNEQEHQHKTVRISLPDWGNGHGNALSSFTLSWSCHAWKLNTFVLSSCGQYSFLIDLKTWSCRNMRICSCRVDPCTYLNRTYNDAYAVQQYNCITRSNRSFHGG
jgi:hypothetical protein